MFNEEERKAMMMAEHRRREEVKRLLEDEDENHLNSAWSNPKQLATGLQGLSSVSWKPK